MLSCARVTGIVRNKRNKNFMKNVFILGTTS